MTKNLFAKPSTIKTDKKKNTPQNSEMHQYPDGSCSIKPHFYF